MHRWQTGPIARPTGHVLLVASLEKLQFAQFTLLIEILHEQKLTRINHRLHHHVLKSGGLSQRYNFFALLCRGRHWHCAGDMLTCLQCCDRLRTMIWNGCIDMNSVDIWILKQLIIIAITCFDTKLVSNLIERLLVTLTDCIHIRVWMLLVDRDEFCTKPEANYSYIICHFNIFIY